jgi:tRNA(Ile)-lysidine synthase TilS/MesJ
MAAYAIARGIEYIYEECPFAVGSQQIFYKEALNQLETARPGAKLTFYIKFLDAKQSGELFISKETDRKNLNACPECGQATSAPGLCSFCRLMEKAKAETQ